MKVVIILISIVILLPCVVNTQDFWQSTHGPKCGRTNTLTINSNGYIFAGTADGVYRSVVSTAVEEINAELPLSFELLQNYPNPFNPSTMINYQLPKVNNVELSIYNLLGQKVTTLVSERQHPGQHQVKWNASGFASGIYYYMIKAGEFRQVKKMVLVR
jgi:hypothetical protein